MLSLCIAAGEVIRLCGPHVSALGSYEKRVYFCEGKQFDSNGNTNTRCTGPVLKHRSPPGTMGLGNKLDYLWTADGVLNFFEVCGLRITLPAAHWLRSVLSDGAAGRHWVAALQLSAFSFTCNAAQLLVASCLSPSTGYLMHHMLYYAVCLVSPAATYGTISFALVRQEGAFTPVT
ncbi:hypothetical protein MRX96_052969, partial [Rhipicephalus microplus]